MFIKNQAFTLIELMVVVSIMMLVTIWLWFSFFRFLDTQKINTNLDQFLDEFSELDKKINNKEIYDYEAYFKPEELGYYYYINNFDLKYRQKLNIDFKSLTWVIFSSGSLSWPARLLKIYKKHKLYLERIFDAADYYTWSFDWAKNY